MCLHAYAKLPGFVCIYIYIYEIIDKRLNLNQLLTLAVYLLFIIYLEITCIYFTGKYHNSIQTMYSVIVMTTFWKSYFIYMREDWSRHTPFGQSWMLFSSCLVYDRTSQKCLIAFTTI